MQMPDIFYEVKDTINDKLAVVKASLPFDIDEYSKYILPGVGAVLGTIAIIVALKAGSASSDLKNQSKKFNAGERQLEAVLVKESEPDNSMEANDLIGRSDLMIQYRGLSNMQNNTGFGEMERMSNVSSDAENAASVDRDNMFYQSIVDFAGKFGGVLVKKTEEQTEADIRLAAYQNEEDMTAPADSTVNNVLVQHLGRTIPASAYGESDRHDTLIILSGTDIRKFSAIEKGSVMYTTFGSSTGSKTSKKYVCTGIEPGSVEGGVFTESTAIQAPSETEMSFDEADTETAASETPSDTVNSEEVETVDESSATYMPQTGAETDDGIRTVQDDGTVVYEDGTKVSPDGTVVYADGTRVDADGTVTYTDGMIVHPDGTITGGTFTPIEGSSSGDSSDSEKKEDGQTEQPADDFAKDSVFTRTVYSANGTPITQNKTNALVFYMMNSQTGAVTITYWDVAGFGTEPETSVENY